MSTAGIQHVASPDCGPCLLACACCIEKLIGCWSDLNSIAFVPAQTTGEAQFAGDIKLVGMHHAALVTSTRPHARLVSVDASAALQVSIRDIHRHHQRNLGFHWVNV